MPVGEVVGTLSSTDASGLAVSYTITGGTNANNFTINSSGALVNLVTTTSFLGAQSEDIIITAKDSAGAVASQEFHISVLAQNVVYGSGDVSAVSGQPNMFESDGSQMNITGFNENNGDNLNFSLLLANNQLDTSNIKLVGTDASNIAVMVNDGTGNYYEAFDLLNAVSKDGILTGHTGAITTAQLTTLEHDWLATNTIHN